MGTNSNKKKKSSHKSREQINAARQKSKMDLTEPDPKKKAWSTDALVEAMQPSTEELEYRQEKSQEVDFVQKYSKLFKCTKCQSSIKSIVVKHEKVPIHPSLGVLMCQKCCDFYEDGEFSLDSDGEDKYCRWCGEGGMIFSCSKCISGFCASCIKQHFKSEYFKQVQKDENWLCFFCNPKPLWDHRFICALAVKMSEDASLSSSESKKNKDENNASCEDTDSHQNDIEEDVTTPVRSSKRIKLIKTKKKEQGETPAESENTSKSRSRGRSQQVDIYTSSSDESDSESPLKKVKCTSTPLQKLSEKAEADSFENLKSSVLCELKKILTLSEHQMDFGRTWSNKMLKKLTSPDYITDEAALAKECQKIKQFLSILSTFLVQFSTSVDSVENNLLRSDGLKVWKSCQRDSPNRDQAAYRNILQFLGFIRGQVKTFMEKGISLPDVIGAEVYDDDKIIGIKKKSKSSKEICDQSQNKGGNDDTQAKTSTEQNKIEGLDKIRGDDILEFVGEQTVDKDDFDSEDTEDTDDFHRSSDTNIDESDETRVPMDPKDDIREILEVLEGV